MGIHNTHMYEKAVIAMAKQSVTLEVLSYHASASIDDAKRLRVRSSSQFHLLNDPITFFVSSDTQNTVGGVFSVARLRI